MLSIKHILVATLASIVLPSALAVQPPEAPGSRSFSCSINGRWCVESKSQEVGIRVFERTTGKNTLAWSAPLKAQGWITVTNDGACVIDFVSRNLIEPDITPSNPAIAVVCKDSAPYILPINKFIADFATLPRIERYRRFAETFGLDNDDHLTVRTVEGRTFIIDPRSGHLISGSWIH